MPAVTGARQALLDMRRPFGEWNPGGANNIQERQSIRETTEYADVAAAPAHVESLELELRAPNGSVVPTEWIDARDNEVTLSLAREDEYPTLPDPLFAETEEDKQLLASIEHDAALLEEWLGPDWDDDSDGRPWEEKPEFPRYQIQVGLFNDAAIP